MVTDTKKRVYRRKKGRKGKMEGEKGLNGK